MKLITRRWKFLAAGAFLVLALSALIATAPKHPVAVIRVVDASNKPIAGAVIHPEGFRTKPGPNVSGWYGWRADLFDPVRFRTPVGARRVRFQCVIR